MPHDAMTVTKLSDLEAMLRPGLRPSNMITQSVRANLSAEVLAIFDWLNQRASDEVDRIKCGWNPYACADECNLRMILAANGMPFPSDVTQDEALALVELIPALKTSGSTRQFWEDWIRAIVAPGAGTTITVEVQLRKFALREISLTSALSGLPNWEQLASAGELSGGDWCTYLFNPDMFVREIVVVITDLPKSLTLTRIPYIKKSHNYFVPMLPPIADDSLRISYEIR